eukprot:3980741-Pyramimonas_sp.AAC.3
MPRRGPPPKRRKRKGWRIDLSKYDDSEDDGFKGDDDMDDGAGGYVDDEPEEGHEEAPGFDAAVADDMGGHVDLAPEPEPVHMDCVGAVDEHDT